MNEITTCWISRYTDLYSFIIFPFNSANKLIASTQQKYTTKQGISFACNANIKLNEIYETFSEAQQDQVEAEPPLGANLVIGSSLPLSSNRNFHNCLLMHVHRSAIVGPNEKFTLN